MMRKLPSNQNGTSVKPEDLQHVDYETAKERFDALRIASPTPSIRAPPPPPPPPPPPTTSQSTSNPHYQLPAVKYSVLSAKSFNSTPCPYGKKPITLPPSTHPAIIIKEVSNVQSGSHLQNINKQNLENIDYETAMKQFDAVRIGNQPQDRPRLQ